MKIGKLAVFGIPFDVCRVLLLDATSPLMTDWFSSRTEVKSVSQWRERESDPSYSGAAPSEGVLLRTKATLVEYSRVVKLGGDFTETHAIAVDSRSPPKLEVNVSNGGGGRGGSGHGSDCTSLVTILLELKEAGTVTITVSSVVRGGKKATARILTKGNEGLAPAFGYKTGLLRAMSATFGESCRRVEDEMTSFNTVLHSSNSEDFDVDFDFRSAPNNDSDELYDLMEVGGGGSRAEV